jgi:class 3 adenylate cyclase
MPAKPPAVAPDAKKLSIIFAADVAGYSRMMSEDEDRTLAMLERARRWVDALIAEKGGRIANTAGDSVIAVFESAGAALACSVEIQRKLGIANKKYPPNKRLLFRIGLHMGEIYQRGEDILGSGVNIAARLEGQAQPGAVCMSEAFFSLVDKSASKLPVADLGRLSLKNIDIPIQAYEILSRRAAETGVAFRQQKKIALQNRRAKMIGVAIGAVLAAILLAGGVAYSFITVAVMAENNRPPRYEAPSERGVPKADVHAPPPISDH